jgi:hypothetical protein
VVCTHEPSRFLREAGVFDITPWTDRFQVIDAESAGPYARGLRKPVQAMRAAVDDDPFPKWEDTSPEVYLFEDV